MINVISGMQQGREMIYRTTTTKRYRYTALNHVCMLIRMGAMCVVRGDFTVSGA